MNVTFGKIIKKLQVAGPAKALILVLLLSICACYFHLPFLGQIVLGGLQREVSLLPVHQQCPICPSPAFFLFLPRCYLIELAKLVQFLLLLDSIS